MRCALSFASFLKAMLRSHSYIHQSHQLFSFGPGEDGYGPCTDTQFQCALLWSRGQIRMRRWPRRPPARQRSSRYFRQLPARLRQVPPPVQQHQLPLDSRLPDPHSHRPAPRRRACNRSRCLSAPTLFGQLKGPNDLTIFTELQSKLSAERVIVGCVSVRYHLRRNALQPLLKQELGYPRIMSDGVA